VTRQDNLTLPHVAAAALAIVVLGITIFWAVSQPEETTAGASAYSRSAIGHAGLLALLQERGVPASASRGASREKLGGAGLLVIAEPDFDSDDATLRSLLRAPRVLLVLPKWTGDSDRAGWLTFATLKPLSFAQAPLDSALPEAELLRSEKSFVARSALLRGAAPVHLELPAQLVAPGTLAPLIVGAEGVLLGYTSTRWGKLWVLSDPDVISNHGLAAGNAAAALAIIERARRGGPVVFDETIHGFGAVPSGALRLLAARPFAGAGINALLAIGLLLWANGRRFAVDPPAAPGIAAGHLPLIANIADLLLYTGHLNDLARRYVDVTIADVTARLRGAETMSQAGRGAWLAEAEARRGTYSRAADLLANAARLGATRARNAAQASALVRAAHRWRQEMLDES
jgi:hypothetical protein